MLSSRWGVVRRGPTVNLAAQVQDHADQRRSIGVVRPHCLELGDEVIEDLRRGAGVEVHALGSLGRSRRYWPCG